MRTSFSLSSRYSEGMYTQLFELVQFAGLQYTEAYNMPIKLRSWWYEKTVTLIEEKNKN